MPIIEIDAPTLLEVVRKIERRGAVETAHVPWVTAAKSFAMP